jgi:hypothetical protein
MSVIPYTATELVDLTAATDEKRGLVDFARFGKFLRINNDDPCINQLQVGVDYQKVETAPGQTQMMLTKQGVLKMVTTSSAPPDTVAAFIGEALAQLQTQRIQQALLAEAQGENKQALQLLTTKMDTNTEAMTRAFTALSSQFQRRLTEVEFEAMADQRLILEGDRQKYRESYAKLYDEQVALKAQEQKAREAGIFDCDLRSSQPTTFTQMLVECGWPTKDAPDDEKKSKLLDFTQVLNKSYKKDIEADLLDRERECEEDTLHNGATVEVAMTVPLYVRTSYEQHRGWTQTLADTDGNRERAQKCYEYYFTPGQGNKQKPGRSKQSTSRASKTTGMSSTERYAATYHT